MKSKMQILGISFFLTNIVVASCFYLNPTSRDSSGVDCWDYRTVVLKTDGCCKHTEDDDENEASKNKELSEQVVKCVMKFTEGAPAVTREDIVDKIGCITECSLNGTEALTSDKQVNAEMFLHHYDHLDDEIWKTLWKTSVETCLDKSAGRITENMKCRSGIMYFIPCLWEETTTNCPSEKLDSSREECSSVKAYIEKCSIFKTL